MTRRGIVEEDSLPPDKALHSGGKLLTSQGMEGMGDSEAWVPIRVIGCSCQFIHTANSKVRSIG